MPAIGRIEATLHEDDWAEVAYLLGPAYQGRGDATRAMRWLLAHLRDLGATDVWAAIHPANARSIALARRLGFTAAPLPPARPLGSYDPGDAVFVAR
jgi:RimJ/RimL family protein N-acetyltransferase